MSHHIVEVEELRYSYPDGTEALKGVNFRIEHGESVAVVGANGAGKSTLLLHLNGYLTPEQGKVRIGDYPLNRDTVQDIRRTVGMVFQDPDDQLFMPSVYDDVAFGPLNLGYPAEEVEKRVIEALQQVAGTTLPKTQRITNNTFRSMRFLFCVPEARAVDISVARKCLKVAGFWLI